MPAQKYTEVPRQNPAAFHKPQEAEETKDVIVIGGGFAGLSAAVYLARAMRDAVVIDAGHSLALWEREIQNYLGFPEGISGEELLQRAREQATRYGATLVTDEVKEVGLEEGISSSPLPLSRSDDGEEVSTSGLFWARGKQGMYRARRMLLCTGLYHIPPEIPEVDACLGRSMFFCKHCDGYRVQGRRILILGNNNHAVEYALGLLLYSPCVVIATNGEAPAWDEQHQRWINEYAIPMCGSKVAEVRHENGHVRSVRFDGGHEALIDTIFTTRGDLFFNRFAKALGAKLDNEGQVLVDEDMRTSVPGLYAAGCITPANCQMIIAAGQGATAAQAINSDLFAESLQTHSLRRYRAEQLECEQTVPERVDSKAG